MLTQVHPRSLLLLVIAIARDALAEQEVWLAGIQPFVGGLWDAGISMRFGAEIMLEEINANPDLLPGYRLRTVWQNGGCNPETATERFLENLLMKKYKAFAPSVPISALDADGDGAITREDTEAASEFWTSAQVRPDPIGLLGPGCSSASLALANIAAKIHMPLISNAATRVSLSDRSKFPNFFRTIMPDTAFNAAWVGLALMLNQSSIVPIIGDAVWASMGARLAEDAAAQGVELAGTDLAEAVAPGFRGIQVLKATAMDARQGVQDLYRLKRRIAVLLILDTPVRLVLCEAYRQGFHNVIYMTFGWLPYGWWTGTDTACTPQQVTQMATYFISANVVMSRHDEDTRLSCSHNMTAGQFMREWYSRQGAPFGDLRKRPEGYFLAPEAATTADAVCMYAQMLQEVLVRQRIPLGFLSARTPRAYQVVQGSFARTDFEGVQGRVRFAPGSADPKGSVILQQLQGGAFVDIALYDHPSFKFLGKANLTFHFPGETVFAGPAGAARVSTSVAWFRHCPGSQITNFLNNTCESCVESMEFSEFAGMCMCRAGYFQSDGACLDCPGGKFSNAAGALQCADCEAGKFSHARARACSYCPRASFSDAKGSASCTSCPAMYTTRDIASSDPSACVCGLGSYGSDGGCRACPANANTTSIGSVSVSQCKCREGYFMSDSFSECMRCPTGSTTSGDAKTAISSCLCDRDTYMPLDTSGCSQCPKGMNCPRGSNEANAQYLHLEEIAEDQQFLELQPQYWAPLTEPMSVFRCRQAGKCPGGKPGVCAPNLEGLVCEHCKAGYKWNGQACIECDFSPLTTLAVLPVLPMFIVAAYLVSRDKVESWASWRNGAMGAGFVTLYHYQTANTVYSYDIVGLPKLLESFSDVWSFTNDPSTILPTECLEVDFYTMMIMKAVAPMVIAGVCAALHYSSILVARVFGREGLILDRDRLFHICGSILFTFFSAIATLSLSIFKCVKHPNGRKTLVPDMSVICFESDEWMSVLGIGIACVLLYLVGLGSAFLRALYIAPACFADPSFQARWKFLFAKFHSSAYWWSMMLPLRTVLINMAFVVTTDGRLQVYLSLAITMFYLAGAVPMMPFRWSAVNFAHIFEGMIILYSGATLLAFTEAAGAAASGADVAALVVECLPICTFICAAAYLFQYGKRVPPLPAEVAAARLTFREFRHLVGLFAGLDEDVGTALLLSIDDWEHRYISTISKVIRIRLFGLHSKSMVVDHAISQKATKPTVVPASLCASFYGESVMVGTAVTAYV